MHNRLISSDRLIKYLRNKNMNYIRNLFVTCLVSLLVTITSKAQWTQTNLLAGGVVNSFASVGTHMFAGTWTGIYMSSNNGKSWTDVTHQLSKTGVPVLTSSGNNLYAVINGVLFFSNDLAAKWTPLGNGPDLHPISALACFSDKLFAGTNGYGTYFSTDNGQNWIQANAGLGSLNVSSFAVCGNNLFVRHPGGISMWDSPGGKWKQLLNAPVTSLAALNDNSGTAHLFAGDNGAVHVSANSGTSWTKVTSGLSEGNIISLAVSSTQDGKFVVYGGNDKGEIVISQDNGLNWNKQNSGIPNVKIRALAVSDNCVFAGTSGYGVYTSADKGTSWTKSNNGLSRLKIYSLALSGNILLAGTDSSGMFMTTDDGCSWENTSSGISNRFVSSLYIPEQPENSQTMFAGTHGDGVYKSTDNGKSWKIVWPQITVSPVYVEDFAVYSDSTGNLNLFAGVIGGIYKTADDGLNWKSSANGLTYKNVMALASNKKYLFAGTSGGGVFISTNSGVNWKNSVTGLTNNVVVSLTAAGDDVFAGTRGGGVYKFLDSSSSSGPSWIPVSKGLKDKQVWALAQKGNNLFAATDSGVFVSGDKGENWNEISEGLPDVRVIALAIGDAVIYAGTYGDGLYKLPLAEVVTSAEEIPRDMKPEKFSLHQNYPNPFNPTTTISYSIAERGYVELKVYDIMGREAATLVSGEKEPGEYNVAFNASKLSSGVYIYKLQSGSSIQTKKLCLLK